MGPKREEVLTADDKRRTAYHEAGHALVAWLEPEADPPQKVIDHPARPGRRRDLHRRPTRTATTTAWTTSRPAWPCIMGGRAADRLVYDQPFAGARGST